MLIVGARDAKKSYYLCNSHSREKRREIVEKGMVISMNGDKNQYKVDEMIQRINALYHKSQSEGLTDAEKEEQDKLRHAYAANIRNNLRGQLNNISIVERDGSVTNLGEKFGKNEKS